MPFSIVFSAGGPLLGGVLYDQTGDYTLPFAIFAVAGLVGGVLLLAAAPPRYPGEVPAPEAQDEPAVAPAGVEARGS
jgi:hypothetical protein